ncbi:unnamed protein product, partial [marine sediment metagenome]
MIFNITFFIDNINKIYGLLFIYKGQPGVKANPIKYSPASFTYILNALSSFHLIFSLIGISLIIIFRKKYRTILLWLIPWLLFFIFMTQVSRFGLFWPGWRFIIYLPLGTSLLASLPIQFIIDIVSSSGSKSKIKLNTVLSKNKFIIKINKRYLLSLLIILPILMPLFYWNTSVAYERHGWSGWD